MRSELPVLYTSRLILREIEQSDMFDMYEYATSPLVGPQAGWEPHISLAHTREIINMFRRKPVVGQLGVYAVVLKDTKKMIGTVELHTYTKEFKAELGYTISPAYWGKGYAAEASRAVISWGFHQLDLKRIECSAFTTNEQSQRVCEKLGLTFEGIRRKGYQLYDKTIHDLSCYAITDDEFFQRLKQGEW